MSEDSPQAGAHEPAPRAPWEVWIGSRGGFTGGGSGHLIRSDGGVYSWSQATAGSTPTTKALGRVTPEALQALERAMTAPDLRALKHLETGNMTGFLEWRQDADVREYSWAERAGAQPLPAPLQRAYGAALAVVTSVRP